MEDGYGVWFLERATFIISARSRGPLTCVLVRSGTRVGEGMEKWNVSPNMLEEFVEFEKWISLSVGILLLEYFFFRIKIKKLRGEGRVY